MSMPAAFASARASSATIVGVILFAGSFAIRRAVFTAWPTASPRRSASRTFPSTAIVTVASGGSRRSSGLLRWASGRHIAKCTPSTAAWAARASPMVVGSMWMATVFASVFQSDLMPALAMFRARSASYSARFPAPTTTTRPSRSPPTWVNTLYRVAAPRSAPRRSTIARLPRGRVRGACLSSNSGTMVTSAAAASAGRTERNFMRSPLCARARVGSTGGAARGWSLDQ